jgi:sulfite exporter TauE/SafE
MTDPSLLGTLGPEAGSLALFAVVGVLGGAHCLGMCGPLVTMYAREMDGDRVDFHQIHQHLVFNLGRTASYALIGGLMGLLGATVYDAADIANVANGIRGVAGVVVGGFILLVGVRYLLGETAGHLDAVPGADRLFRAMSGRLAQPSGTWVDGPRIGLLGAVHGLLPCPILYPAFLYVLARGDPVFGVLALGVLGLGTLPTLFAYGTVIGSVSATSRQRLHRVLGAAFVVMGLIPLFMGLRLVGLPAPSLPVPFYQPF